MIDGRDSRELPKSTLHAHTYLFRMLQVAHLFLRSLARRGTTLPCLGFAVSVRFHSKKKKGYMPTGQLHKGRSLNHQTPERLPA
jgi:hypothetical protein